MDATVANLLVPVLVVHRHDRHLHPYLLGVQENRERWMACLLVIPEFVSTVVNIVGRG